MQKRAKELVPVDTGETRDHIEIIKQEPFTQLVISTRPSTDGSGFDVPSFLEFKEKAYLRPALEEERGVFLDELDKLFDGVL